MNDDGINQGPCMYGLKIPQTAIANITYIQICRNAIFAPAAGGYCRRNAKCFELPILMSMVLDITSKEQRRVSHHMVSISTHPAITGKQYDTE